MPTIISTLLREQIRLVKPLITNFSVSASRALQEALGELGARVVADKVDFTELDVDGVPSAWAVPRELAADDRRVALYLHGGGYVAGSIKYAQGFAGVLANAVNVRVLCAAYRLAPEYPFPAALEDALTAYDHLLASGYAPQDISLIGESAGGGLIVALCLKLKELGRPLPGRLAALSPWTDLTLSGPSHQTKRWIDPALSARELDGFVEAYAPTQTQNPLVSPVFGDMTGLPPCQIYVGGDEMLLDDAVMLAERMQTAGVPCELTVEDGMWHAYVLYGVPEANDALERIRAFLEVSGIGR